MVWLKQCKKCGGDLYQETDQYGVYLACMQCGYVAAERSAPASAKRPSGVTQERPSSREDRDGTGRAAQSPPPYRHMIG